MLYRSDNSTVPFSGLSFWLYKSEKKKKKKDELNFLCLTKLFLINLCKINEKDVVIHEGFINVGVFINENGILR